MSMLEGRKPTWEEIQFIIEAHRHYRGIAIGYTATIITLSTLEIGYLAAVHMPSGKWILFIKASIILLIIMVPQNWTTC